jgi:hypothetical protein
LQFARKQFIGSAKEVKMKVIVVRESVFQSVIKDSFMFGSLFALWFLNHKFCNGSGIIDVCVALFVLFGAINHAKKYYSPKEAVDALRELALQDTKELRKQQPTPQGQNAQNSTSPVA